MPGKRLTSYLLFKSSEKVNLIFNLNEQLNKNILMQKVAKVYFYLINCGFCDVLKSFINYRLLKIGS